ncbi:probable glutamate receptor [Haliotis cracherodii]|uniref:probable glutamate receptor n=1 Tax=Haliotis cracherodii TaxID=6455 RepID=UPI0039E8736E
MLLQLLLSLNWQAVLVLHTQGLDPSFVVSLEASGILYVDFDIDSSTREYLLRILRDVENVLQPHLHVLILCDVTNTVSVLRRLSGICGTRSNSSVDWCHMSRVLVVGRSEDLPVLLDSNIQVENVALLELPTGQGHATKPRMWTLMFHQNGRAFTDVELSNRPVANRTEVFPNVKLGYNGKQLTVVMKDTSLDYGYEIVNERRVLGYPFRILNMMAQHLNFSYRLIPPREDQWGKNINGSWTGVIGMLQRREADLASDWLTIHNDRTTVSDFILPPIGENKRMILYRKENDIEENHLLVFLRPFQPGVFLIFGGALIIFVAVLSSIRIIHKKDNLKNHVSSKENNFGGNTPIDEKGAPSFCANQTITSTGFEVYGTTLKQGSTIRSSHDSERILITGWWIFTTVMSAVYCGTMMATFAVKLEKPPFSTTVELASKMDYAIGYESASITENVVQNSNEPHVVSIKQRIHDLSIKDPALLSTNTTKHLKRVQEGKYAFITGMLILPLANAKCQLELIDSRLGSLYTAFHLPKSSPFKHDLQETYVNIYEKDVRI